MTPNGPFALTTGSNGAQMQSAASGVQMAAHVAAAAAASTNEDVGIREVWSHNLEEEFKRICHVVVDYPFVAMDTEFPGVVARPIGEFRSTADYQYQLLRCNVDLLKIIQLGLTFLDDKGNLPDGITTWQFNFKFNLTEDMYAEDSVDLLQNSGIQFEKHEQEGINPNNFAEKMIASGLVLMEPVKWLSFHSGYDFGYLLNLLTAQNLPKTESEFFEALRLYFPNVYDVKYLMKSCKNLKGGLQEVANELEVPRIGPQHQAGSDSLLTGQTFFKMKEMFFEDDIDDSKYCGHLYGLGTNFVVPSTTASTSMTTSASTPAMPSDSTSSGAAAADGTEPSHAATTAKLETVPDEPEPASSTAATSGGLTMAIDKEDKEKTSEDGDVKMADVSESGSGQQKEGSANKEGDSADESAGGEGGADKTASGENTQEDQASA